MTLTRFRIVKHATAAFFAAAMVGLFLLGVDGLLRSVGELRRVFATREPEAPSATDALAPAGVVRTFIVPPDSTTPAKKEPRRSGAPVPKDRG